MCSVECIHLRFLSKVWSCRYHPCVHTPSLLPLWYVNNIHAHSCFIRLCSHLGPSPRITILSSPSVNECLRCDSPTKAPPTNRSPRLLYISPLLLPRVGLLDDELRWPVSPLTEKEEQHYSSWHTTSTPINIWMLSIEGGGSEPSQLLQLEYRVQVQDSEISKFTL